MRVRILHDQEQAVQWATFRYDAERRIWMDDVGDSLDELRLARALDELRQTVEGDPLWQESLADLEDECPVCGSTDFCDCTVSLVLDV